MSADSNYNRQELTDEERKAVNDAWGSANSDESVSEKLLPSSYTYTPSISESPTSITSSATLSVKSSNGSEYNAGSWEKRLLSESTVQSVELWPRKSISESEGFVKEFAHQDKEPGFHEVAVETAKIYAARKRAIGRINDVNNAAKGTDNPYGDYLYNPTSFIDELADFYLDKIDKSSKNYKNIQMREEQCDKILELYKNQLDSWANDPNRGGQRVFGGR